MVPKLASIQTELITTVIYVFPFFKVKTDQLKLCEKVSVKHRLVF